MSAIAVENRQQSQLHGLPYEHMRYQPPQFTNPWAPGTTGPAPNVLYAGTVAPTAGPLDSTSQPQMRPAALNLQYPSAAASAAPLGTGSVIPAGPFEPPDLLGPSQDILNTSRSYGTQYTASPSPNTYAPTSSAAYPMDYANRTANYGFSQDPARRLSHPSVTSASMLGLPESPRQRQSSLINFDRLSEHAQRSSFTDALEASRGMVSMANDITPRNIYGDAGNRNSVSSYGFPSTHSAHSSISSASYNPSYYSGSVGDSSVTDYSSASESVDLDSRTLPRPPPLIGTNLPPAPQSMMSQFSSKVASSSQKKHKCKICDKRFTRPSSLQTHMYSHTGEKRMSNGLKLNSKTLTIKSIRLRS